MVWLIIILLVIFLFFGWLLISPFILEVDTRTAKAELRWISIGKATIWFEEEWWLSFRVLFYTKKVRLSAISKKPKRKKTPTTKKRKKGIRILPRKLIRVIRTFRISKWKLAIDTGDYALNGILYPLNFLPKTFDHLYFNFMDENYLLLKIRNRPWKLLYALLR